MDGKTFLILAIFWTGSMMMWITELSFIFRILERICEKLDKLISK
jgi:hypothetical protein